MLAVLRLAIRRDPGDEIDERSVRERVRSGAMVDCAGADAAKERTKSRGMWVFMDPPVGGG
jgi:hypothetical protein